MTRCSSGEPSFSLQWRPIGDQYHRSVPHSYDVIGVLLSASKGQCTCFLSLSKMFSPPAVTMNDYKVIGQIGEGAFGKAFLVQERQRGDGACRCVVKEVDLRKVGSSPTWQAASFVFLCWWWTHFLSHDSMVKVQTDRQTDGNCAKLTSRCIIIHSSFAHRKQRV